MEGKLDRIIPPFIHKLLELKTLFFYILLMKES